ncbi:hypothetical protein BS78_05G099700 [Paspalum vaginatum]|nr:hypothetical protein BS78_05G099700 [Paspalum vaginatum]
MAASIVSACAAPNQLPAASQETTGGAPFKPCVWGDFFVNYSPPPSQVRRKLEAAKKMGTADVLMLVDTLERLRVDSHFRKDIDLALDHVYMEEPEIVSSDELHIVSLHFRLLRQHGFWVSSDVFDKFRDDTGSFSKDLVHDVRGLLSLYNASHMATPGEQRLDEAISFSRQHLEAAKGKLGAPLSEQVSRFLNIPLPRFMPSLEAVRYIPEYEQEEGHDMEILELAKLDYTLVNNLHLKELRALTLWWRDLYQEVNLPYTRDRIVEMYFWLFGTFHEEEYSQARLIASKIVAITSLMDDTYDVHASLEDAMKFNEATQRWDESAVSLLPEYLRMLYIKTMSNFQEFEDSLAPNDKYGVPYSRKMYKLQSQLYLEEAKWCHQNHLPSFREQLQVTAVTAGFPLISVAAWMGAGNLATKNAFEWGVSVPDILRSSGEVGRLLNDIASYKKGKNKKDVASALECYLKEHGCTGEEAAVACSAMVEHAWRKINRDCMEIKPSLVPPAALLATVNLTRTSEIFYYGGRDGYTFGGDLQEVVTTLFLKGPAV